jgi:hypothetical protein
VIRRFTRRRNRAVAAVLSGVVALAAPTAVAATSDDLRSPDARDAAVAAQQQAQAAGDLRSPDARDAALAAQQQPQSGVGYSDLRSPDARDAALGTTAGSQPASEPAPVATPTVISVEEGGSQTLAIVFSAIALVIALLAIGFTALARRPRPRWSAP